jgi:hypothetical protein
MPVLTGFRGTYKDWVVLRGPDPPRPVTWTKRGREFQGLRIVMFITDIILHLNNVSMTDTSAIQKTRTYLSRIVFLFHMLLLLVQMRQAILLLGWTFQNMRDRQIAGRQKKGKRFIVFCLAVFIWGSPSSSRRATCWLRHSKQNEDFIMEIQCD